MDATKKEVEDNILADENSIRTLLEEAQKTLEDYQQFSDVLSESRSHVISSFIVSIWSAYEAFCSDAWENLVNKNPSLAKKMDSRQINLQVLARYDYKLENKMGTILKEKYSFKSAKGIEEAYSDILGVDIRKAFEDKNLFYIEKIRHLIVHRASKVDQEFIRHTHSDVDEGDYITFDEIAAYEFAEVVIESVIKIADHILSKNLQ